MMKALLLGQPCTADLNFYDVRYFYFDKKGVGYATSGVARRTLMALYREKHLHSMDAVDWCATIRSSDNPIVRGYLAEQVCLAYISRDGLTAISSQLTPPVPYEMFDDFP